MTIFDTSANPKVIKFIPRFDVPIVKIYIQEESSDLDINYLVFTSTTFSWYQTISFTSVFFKENFTYLIKILGANDIVIYEGKGFCTNQPISTFSVNTGQYISNPTNNQYIIYD
jgi:hypothetical protein